MKMRFFDFEVFDGWWLCVFGDEPDTQHFTEDVKKNFAIVSSDDENARDKLLSYFSENYCMTGYNIKHYDLIIVNAIYQGLDPHQVKLVNDMIINPSTKYSSAEHLRLSHLTNRAYRNCVYQDMIDDNTGSLKEKECNLGLDIRETTVSFDKTNLTDSEKAEVIYYCKHDVYALMYYTLKYKFAIDYINNKCLIAKRFNVDDKTMYACTNPKLVGKVLKARRMKFPDADRLDIELPPRVLRYCYDNLPNKVIERVCSSPDAYTEKIFNNTVDFANGGIHSIYAKCMYVESDEDWMLVNLDGASFYPSLLIFFDCLSRAVASKEEYKMIYDERIALKSKPNKTPAEEGIIYADKLVMNSTFGASGCEWLDLYDPYQATKTCRLGQLLLAALANKLYKNVPELQIIQSNTDGILAYFRRKYYDKVMMYCKEWAQLTSIKVDIEEVKCIWQKDVNNYIMIEYDNEKEIVKNRGAWLPVSYVSRGLSLTPLSGFIANKAIIEYLRYGKDIVETIVNGDDIFDYAISCKKGSTFFKCVQRMPNGDEIDLYNCNRVLPTTDTSKGKIYKVKRYMGKISYNQIPNVPEHCLLINNDLKSYDFKSLKKQLDYMYYIAKAASALEVPDELKKTGVTKWRKLTGSRLEYMDNFNYFDRD